jgi:hypothetical protein
VTAWTLSRGFWGEKGFTLYYFCQWPTTHSLLPLINLYEAETPLGGYCLAGFFSYFFSKSWMASARTSLSWRTGFFSDLLILLYRS